MTIVTQNSKHVSLPDYHHILSCIPDATLYQIKTTVMITLKNLKPILGSILMMLITSQVSVAQNFSLNNAASKLTIDGTSNIHDWQITSEDQQGKMVAVVDEGQLVKISQLDFSVKAEGLKSGKGGMDKNTYKALNTDKHKNISFSLKNVENIDCTTTGKCKVTANGNLTIAGNTKPIELVFDAKVNGNSIVLTGTKTLKMTDFKVDPPKAMLGTITTGDEVTIKFNSAYNKQ